MELLVVKHYAMDERPCIKGNGFDGLEIGETRDEAERFVTWINGQLSRMTYAERELGLLSRQSADVLLHNRQLARGNESLKEENERLRDAIQAYGGNQAAAILEIIALQRQNAQLVREKLLFEKVVSRIKAVIEETEDGSDNEGASSGDGVAEA